MNRRSATEQNAPALVTPVPTMLGNNKIFSATILDFPGEPVAPEFCIFYHRVLALCAPYSNYFFALLAVKSLSPEVFH
jgi:hypothetical protein